ncbi:MAG: MarR family transcriptional regulator [Candidatus Dormibacteraeota bacterium]|nr:MarR family transcriptional regulator [Candidatus Dormibacteraeota bacterium]
MRHHRALDARLGAVGVSLVQWDALQHLARRPGASLHDLARLTGQTDQSVGALATRMADRGLIERIPGPGRAVRHRITESGQRVLEQAAPLGEAVLAESMSPLSHAEVEAFGDLLEKLLSADPFAEA